MSKIDKLSISGIRSFVPTGRQTLRFESPLTLIVGVNGSGKTTIIECLKYATTGELPPNSKNGAFIHDPKISGEREVLAQVKLMFTTLPATKTVVTRNLQLSVQKNNKRTMKTLEGTWEQKREDERSSRTCRSADLDLMTLDNLGVAKAILEYVIFCHQDESLWPMAEPNALKKRFDDIFEAQKYTKAIENLTVIRKKQDASLKLFKQAEESDKADKTKAEQCSTRIKRLEVDIERLRSQSGAKTKQLDDVIKEAKAKHEEANTHLDLVNELKNKEEQFKIRKDNVEELRVNIDQLDESDEWLKDTLAQYETKVARYEKDHEQAKAEYNTHQKELQKTRKNLDDKASERGQLRSDKERYERQLESRVELIHQAARAHTIRGFDGQLDDRQVKQFGEKIQKMFNDKKRELEHLQKENSDEQDKQAATISDLEGRNFSRSQEKHAAKTRIGSLEKKAKATQNQLNAVDIDEGKKAVLDASFGEADQHLRNAIRDFQSSGVDSKIQQESDNLIRLEAENDRIGRELMECTRLAQDRAGLEVQKKQLAAKKRDLEQLKNTWGGKISALIGSSWKVESVNQEYQQILRERTTSLEGANRERSDAQQNEKQARFALSNVKERAKARDSELEKCKDAVRNALKAFEPGETPIVENLPQKIESLEEKILELEKEVSLFDAMKEFYQKCQKAMNKNNKCQLCDRAFGGPAEKAKLMQRIKDGIDDNNKTAAQEELDGLEGHLGSLRSVRTQYDTYMKLSAAKSGLDNELQTRKAELDASVSDLEEKDRVVEQRVEERQDVESLNRSVSEISRTHRDIVDAESELDRVVSQQQSSATVRSADEIHELQENCNDQMRAAKNKINKHQGDKQQMRELISRLELEKEQLSGQVNNASRQLERKKDIESQLEAIREDIAHQRNTIQQADQEMATIQPEIEKARVLRADLIQQGRDKEKKIANERDELANSVGELKMVESDIRHYVDNDGPSKLALCERAIQGLNQTIQRIEKDISELAVRSNKLKEEISDSGRRKKNINDNLNYRRYLRQIDDLETEIRHLKDRRASEDYERLMAEFDALESKRAKLTAERGSIMGSIKAKDEELNGLAEQWEEYYINSAQKYRKSHIEVETTKAALEDLKNYKTALDHAIMRYHALKMEEINRVAQELWQEVYSGTDIDFIAIRAESETPSTTSTRSAYSYRVCMVKSGVEMDMRGRCSAGQKVLACIIIRLALAESFGTNCGLIALDEPTTNLDSDNIRSLAGQLHKIIERRRSQRNFQLIIITHDEEFLRYMRCSDFVDNFYRVRRNESQQSVIKAENITMVNE